MIILSFATKSRIHVLTSVSPKKDLVANSTSLLMFLMATENLKSKFPSTASSQPCAISIPSSRLRRGIDCWKFGWFDVILIKPFPGTGRTCVLLSCVLLSHLCLGQREASQSQSKESSSSSRRSSMSWTDRSPSYGSSSSEARPIPLSARRCLLTLGISEVSGLRFRLRL